MTNAASWCIIVGFFLLVFGIILRTVMMMAASDVAPPGRHTLHGRELRSLYRRVFPKSSIPLTTRITLSCGAILLLAGIGFEVWR